jgi:hypothetical protein
MPNARGWTLPPLGRVVLPGLHRSADHRTLRVPGETRPRMLHPKGSSRYPIRAPFPGGDPFHRPGGLGRRVF